ncbi:MAG: phytanoyl-CoA dioxygenase family protein [Rhodospirillaceae bacterium]|nr:phytanoyl-CoA dioxygenase family protein [Rhodospirillaceae bacterium]
MKIDRERFAREGYVAGLPALTPEETARYRAELMRLYETLPAALQKHFINLHGVLAWADELGRHKAILDAVEQLIGPDIFLWKSRGFAKFPGPGHVAWHQDLPHWNLVPDEAITAWVALSDVNEANGCVRVVPGTHRGGSRASDAVADPTNLLSAGLEFTVSDQEAAQAAPMLLKAGQFSLHHGMIVHGSGANVTEAPRLGAAFVYIPAFATQKKGADRHVVLVRGQDRTGGFFPKEPAPTGEDAAQLAAARDYFERLRSGEIPYNVR